MKTGSTICSAKLDKASPAMAIDDLLNEVSSLRQTKAELEENNFKLKMENDYLKERISILQAALYGRKSEKKPKYDPALQPSLFNEIEEEQCSPQPKEEEKTHVKEHSRKKPGRRPIPDDLPRIEIIHDLPEHEKTCSCGCSLTEIGREITERLDIVPAKVQVERHVRIKYACRNCEGTECQEEGKENKGAVKLAPLPPMIIPQGIVTPGLLAHVVVAKYVDAVPLYRQEQQFKRLGVDIGRATLCNWIMLVAAACMDLIKLLKEEIQAGPVINMDETPVQVLNETGRANTTKSYMWVCKGGWPEKPAIIFHYEPTRSQKVAEKLLSNYEGYLQTDGYVGYDLIGNRAGIIHLGCWAHVRRKFLEVVKGTKGTNKAGVAQSVIDLIGKLYRIESKMREQKLKDDEIVSVRNKESKPILDEIKKILDEKKATTPPKSLLGKAISYALNQWPRLTIYVEKPFLRPDNNDAENAIRPFAIGRKNWLFSGSPRGAESSAALYSIIETAKANGLEPYAYLRCLFARLPMAKSEEERKALLPQYIDRNLVKPQEGPVGNVSNTALVSSESKPETEEKNA